VAPSPDFHKIIRSGLRAAEDQQHDLVQGIKHFATLARIIQRRKIVKLGRGISSSDKNIQELDFSAKGNPPSLQAIAMA
jgi:hypothetical protein